jgi:hypothetical protein
MEKKYTLAVVYWSLKIGFMMKSYSLRQGNIDSLHVFALFQRVLIFDMLNSLGTWPFG